MLIKNSFTLGKMPRRRKTAFNPPSIPEIGGRSGADQGRVGQRVFSRSTGINRTTIENRSTVTAGDSLVGFFVGRVGESKQGFFSVAFGGK